MRLVVARAEVRLVGVPGGSSGPPIWAASLRPSAQGGRGRWRRGVHADVAVKDARNVRDELESFQELRVGHVEVTHCVPDVVKGRAS